MPTISRFLGIMISMYYGDHRPAHFHIKYGEHRAKMTIDTLELEAGTVPRRVHALVLEWAALHRAELIENWQRARDGLPLEQIEPLE